MRGLASHTHRCTKSTVSEHPLSASSQKRGMVVAEVGAGEGAANSWRRSPNSARHRASNAATPNTPHNATPPTPPTPPTTISITLTVEVSFVAHSPW
eukprot:52211-Prorocentrum_minimum.AAC.1